MKRLFIILRKSFLLFLAPSLLPLLFADGIAIAPLKYGKFFRWELIEETSQVAFINREKGLEKLIISISVKDKGKSAFWLFPIPAPPEQIKLQILGSLPSFEGDEVFYSAKRELDKNAKYLYATQLYTLFLLATGPTYKGPSAFTGAPALAPPLKGIPVIVHEHLEKGGAISEKVTAKDAEALYNYLKSKGFNLMEGAIPILDYYIGRDYTFIITWSRGFLSRLEERAKAVYVKFPSQRIYYPLYPTSIYKEKEIPIRIFLLGFQEFTPPPTLEPYSSVQHLTGRYEIPFPYASGGEDFEAINEFFGGKKNSTECTLIKINAPAHTFTSDLWLTPRHPFIPYYAQFVFNHSGAICLIILILSSCLAGYLIGRAAFPALQNQPLLLFFLGFANLFTLIMVIMVISSLPTKESKEDIRPILESLREKEYIGKRFWSAFLFIAASVLAAIAIYLAPHYGEFVLIPILGCLVSLWGAISLARVHDEDKELFAKLREAGYSVWFFCPNDSAKLVFLPLFSLTYLFLVLFFKTLIEIPLRFGGGF